MCGKAKLKEFLNYGKEKNDWIASYFGLLWISNLICEYRNDFRRGLDLMHAEKTIHHLTVGESRRGHALTLHNGMK